VTSFSVVSTSITLKDPKPPKKGFKKLILRFSAAAHTPRMNYDEMAEDRMTGTATGFCASREH